MKYFEVSAKENLGIDTLMEVSMFSLYEKLVLTQSLVEELMTMKSITLTNKNHIKNKPKRLRDRCCKGN